MPLPEIIACGIVGKHADRDFPQSKRAEGFRYVIDQKRTDAHASCAGIDRSVADARSPAVGACENRSDDIAFGILGHKTGAWIAIEECENRLFGIVLFSS